MTIEELFTAYATAKDRVDEIYLKDTPIYRDDNGVYYEVNEDDRIPIDELDANIKYFREHEDEIEAMRAERIELFNRMRELREQFERDFLLGPANKGKITEQQYNTWTNMVFTRP